MNFRIPSSCNYYQKFVDVIVIEKAEAKDEVLSDTCEVRRVVRAHHDNEIRERRALT